MFEGLRNLLVFALVVAVFVVVTVSNERVQGGRLGVGDKRS